jgi:hypothetical protein
VLKRLADLAKQGKEIWGFLALVAGLGVSYGRLSSRLDDLKDSVTGLRAATDREFDKVDGRFTAAHAAIERRMDTNDRLVMGVRDAVTRLAVIDEVRGHRPVRVAAIRPPIAKVPPPVPPDARLQRLQTDLQGTIDQVLRQRQPADLPAF